jgi:tRNA threonylcarbamoyladenosine biosynthesis protein TsaE
MSSLAYNSGLPRSLRSLAMTENTFVSNSPKQTQKLGKILAEELRGGETICLSGELGSGKTTFAQGLLKGLGAKGPYTSPTFVVMKQYKPKTQESKLENIFHIDAYRIKAQDIIDLGWEEIVESKKNIAIVEWAEKIRKIIPKNAIWLRFEHLKDDEREIRVY